MNKNNRPVPLIIEIHMTKNRNPRNPPQNYELQAANTNYGNPRNPHD